MRVFVDPQLFVMEELSTLASTVINHISAKTKKDISLNDVELVTDKRVVKALLEGIYNPSNPRRITNLPLFHLARLPEGGTNIPINDTNLFSSHYDSIKDCDCIVVIAKDGVRTPLYQLGVRLGKPTFVLNFINKATVRGIVYYDKTTGNRTRALNDYSILPDLNVEKFTDANPS